MLLDSGAMSSLVNSHVFCQYFPDWMENLESPRRRLIAANGENIKVLGEIELPLTIGSKTFYTKVMVADLGKLDGIIGLNFLRNQGVSVDLGEGLMNVGNWSIRLAGDRVCDEKSSLVRLHEDVYIPQGHEVTVVADVENKPNVINSGFFTVDSIQSLEEINVKLVKAIVRRSSQIPVTLVNESDDDVVLRQGRAISLLSPVQEVLEIRLATEGTEVENKEMLENEKPRGLPIHLESLFEGSGKNLQAEEKQNLRDLLTEYEEVFVGPEGTLGKTNVVKHHIDTGDAMPIKQHPRRIPYSQIDAMNAEIDKMLEKGIIQPSSSPWSSPVVLVKKSDGSLRFCVDYRKLNAVTKKDSFPLPRIDETLDAISGSQFFCVMDLASGFWQIELDDESREKTAFCSRRGLFEFTRLSFGLCNAPSGFARLMSHVLKGMSSSEVLVYVDDIMVHGKTFQATLSSLREVFNRLRSSGLKLKPGKCQLFKDSVKYLGHVVSQEGVSCDPEKLEAIRDWAIPRSVKEVRAMLGTASYYRKYIKNFAKLAAPLTALLHKGVKFIWSEDCQDAFEMIKSHLISAPVLAFPIEDGDFRLDTDASDLGLGAVLSQLQNGEEKVIAYASKTLSPSQQVYCTTYKELLAVRIFVEHFRVYLYGRRFTVRTDHASLRWLKNFDRPEGMVMRWISYLDTFDIQWVHRPGANHGNADGLSRKSPTRRCHYEKCVDCGTESHSNCSVDYEEVLHVVTDQRTETNQVDDEFKMWLKQWSKLQISTWQQSDPDLFKIMEDKGLGHQRPPFKEITSCSANYKTLWAMWDELLLVEGVLYRQQLLSPKHEPILQCIAPKEIRSFILTQLHNSRMAGHLGITKTSNRIRQRFYWPGYRKDVERWCRKCKTCAQTNKRSSKSALVHDLAGSPLERVGIDIVGPLPVSENGNSYILVVVDYFTRWTEAYPIPDQKALTVADKFVSEFITRFGVPERLISDQGTDFMSELFRNMCQLMEIEQARCSPYHPATNGLTERMNATIQSMLSAFVNEYRNDWEEHLPYVLFAYRAAVQESTGCTPNLLMLGREVAAPIDLMFNRGHPPEINPRCFVQYVEWLKQAMDKSFQFARKRMGLSIARQDKYHTKGVRHSPINEGSVVWYHYLPMARRKLSKFWQGPYKVDKKISDVSYLIKRDDSDRGKVVHVDNLKLCLSDDSPDTSAPVILGRGCRNIRPPDRYSP